MDESENQNNSFKKLGTKYLLSVMAACVAEFVTYPLDLTKTRLQIQGKYLVITHTPAYSQSKNEN